MNARYLVGQTTRIWCEVTECGGTGALVDPSALVLVVKKPDATTVTYTLGVDSALVKTAVGKYEVKLLLNMHGRWTWRWEAQNPDTGVGDGLLMVQKRTTD